MTALRRAPLILRLLVGAALALLVGLLLQTFSAAPDPHPTTLIDSLEGRGGYLGESAAPYLLVPFAVGALARTRTGAILSGVFACWLLVAAYYGWFIPGTFAAEHGGAAEQLVWLVAAVGAGSIGGLLGHASRRPGWWRFVMPAALALEPVGWLVLLRLHVAPVLARAEGVVGTAIEAAIGVVWLLLVVVRRDRSDDHGGRSEDDERDREVDDVATSVRVLLNPDV